MAKSYEDMVRQIGLARYPKQFKYKASEMLVGRALQVQGIKRQNLP